MNRVKDIGITNPKPYMNAEEAREIRTRIDSYIDVKMDEWNKTVTHAEHLYKEGIDQDYYRRHTIEHGWRIRMSRTAQGKVLHQIAKVSPHTAQLYAHYQYEEMLHDQLYRQDLEPIGVSEEEFLATEPMFATRLLCAFQYYVAEHESPIGALAYGYLVEYVTHKITPQQVDNLTKELGKEKVRGQAAHINTDLSHEHSEDLWEIVKSFLFSESDVDVFLKYIDEIQSILAMYFEELYQKTVAAKEQKAA